MGNNTKRNNLVFLGIITALHLVYFLLACGFTRIYMGDSFEYIYEAINIKNQCFFYSGNPALPIEPEYLTQRQPIYPLFLCSVYLFAINNWVVIVLQNVLSIVNIWYGRRLLHTLFPRLRFDVFFLIFIVGCPSQFINANTIAPDILLQTCTLLYFGQAVNWLKYQTPQAAVGMGIWLVVGMLVKPVLYPFAVVHVFLMFGWLALHKQMGIKIIIIAMLPVLAVMVYNYTNYKRTGCFHFSSNQAFNAVYYYKPFIEQREGTDSAHRFINNERAALATITMYKDRYDYANRRGKELLVAFSPNYLWFHIMSSMRMFFDPGKAEMDLFSGKLTYGGLYKGGQLGFKETLQQHGWAGVWPFVMRNPSIIWAILVAMLNVFRFIGLVLFITNRDVSINIRVFAGILLGYLALAAGPISNTRYFLPVGILAAMMAAIGWAPFYIRKQPKTGTL